MSTEATLKTGDDGRTLGATLKYADGTVIDLTGATVEFRMRPAGASTNAATASGAATVDADPTTGVVTFDGWEAGDLDTAGGYYAEFHITDSSGNQVVVPSAGYLTIKITQAIGAEA